MEASPPFLRGGFRPFFYGGAAWGLIALVLWLSALAGALVLPSLFEPLAWHRHEMLFGFVGAVIAGFLLTAIPNWTGRLPIAGAPLASLFGLWVAARLAILFSGNIGGFPAAALDVGFFLVLGFIGAREVLASRNRNLPVVGVVLLFALASALDHLAGAGVAPPELGWKLALALIIILISLIGGRITPSFTRNWMAKKGMENGLPTQPGPFDIATIAVTALALLFWITGPDGTVGGALLLLAALLQAVRLARWRGWKTFADPLVLILHLGYAWVPTGLLLLGLGMAGAPVPRSAAIHALTAGAMATMILAVMTRASLGHTARELKANGATLAIYALVTLGALLRVGAPLRIMPYTIEMEIAALAWGGALLIFLIAYAPVLFGPRLGEEGR